MSFGNRMQDICAGFASEGVSARKNYLAFSQYPQDSEQRSCDARAKRRKIELIDAADACSHSPPRTGESPALQGHRYDTPLSQTMKTLLILGRRILTAVSRANRTTTVAADSLAQRLGQSEQADVHSSADFVVSYCRIHQLRHSSS